MDVERAEVAAVVAGGHVARAGLRGREEPDEAATLTWATATERGRRRVYCDVCSREHLRAMEGKLDSEWW